MTDSRKHHFNEKFIVAKLIENDRSESKIGSWFVHNKCYCIDILTRGMVRHDIKKDKRKRRVAAISKRRADCDPRNAAYLTSAIYPFFGRQTTEGKIRRILQFVENYLI